MTSFTRAWSASYEGLPPDSEVAKQGAQRIRELKNDLRERLSVDHSWAGDANDGAHLQITIIPATQDPVTIPNGVIYGKVVGSGATASVELFYKSSTGTISQLSNFQGTQSTLVLPGTIMAFGNPFASLMATAYLSCDGSAVLRATYPALFNAIGIIWGAGVSVVTFNLPDRR